MAGTTTNYGFTTLTEGDAFYQANAKFSNSDRHLLDTILANLEDHHHRGPVVTTGPTVAPDLLVSTTGGTLLSGTRYYYVYTYVDPDTGESAASPVGFVDTPTGVSPPAAATGSSETTGGSLEPGDYYYVLTAYQTSDTVETTVGGYVLVTVPVGTSTNRITLTLPALPSGATGFNIYRRSPGQTHYYYLDSVPMNVATPPSTYVDDGSVNDDCDRGVPTTNTTNATSSVTVTLPGATPSLAVDNTWKIYRTTDTNSWANTFLVHVTAGATPTPAPLFYLDDNSPTVSAGEPPYTGLNNPDPVVLTDAAEVVGVLPPANHIQSHPVEFGFPGVVSVVQGTFIWQCPFDRAYIKEVFINLGRGYAPASTDVIVDVNKYDTDIATPSWGTIFTTQANRPRVVVGDTFGAIATPDVRYLVKGDALTVDVDQAGGGATPTDYDLFVSVMLWVWQSAETTTPAFP